MPGARGTIEGRTPDPGAKRDSTRARARIRRVVLLVVVYLFLLLLASVSAWPWLPRTALGWVVFAVVAPPLYLAVEWAGDRLSGSWWESSAVGKALKLLLFVGAGVLFAVVLAVMNSVVSPR